jgi:hypothetical protein
MDRTPAAADQPQTPENLSRAIADARTKFWATYTDKSVDEKARQKFADLLYLKDNFYLQLNRFDAHGVGRAPQGIAALGNALANASGGAVDGGIPASAESRFLAWVQAFNKNLSANGGLPTVHAIENVRKALDASEKEHRAYVFERDMAEFYAKGILPPDPSAKISAEDQEPHSYAVMLYARFGQISLSDAFENVRTMVSLFGKQIVYDSAREVKAAPKLPSGELAVNRREPVKRDSRGALVPDDSIPAPENVIGALPGPLPAFETLVTRGDDRRYLLGLLADHHPAYGEQSRQVGKWDYALQFYNELESSFGEAEILQASHLVRLARKRLTDGWVMEPNLIGSVRMEPYSVFEDIIARKDPRGYVRILLASKSGLVAKEKVDDAYRSFIAGKNEDKILQDAQKAASHDPDLTGFNLLPVLGKGMR